MNADMNNLNVKIYNELLKLAKSYFNEISGKWIAKSYDAKEAIKALCLYSKESGLHVVERTCEYADVNALKKDPLILSANPRNASLLDHATIVRAYNSGKQFSISVDSFKCSFDACKVFDYLLKFEKLAGIPAKDKAVFIKNVSEKETTNQAKVISFDIDIDKKALPACKHIADDELRPVMNNIFVDVNSKLLVASDGHILSEYPVNIYNIEGEITDSSIFVSPDVLKKCIGACHIDVYLVKKDAYCPQYLTVITNEKGETYKNNTAGRFPNYKSVLPTLPKEGFIKIASTDLKSVLSFMKTCKKLKGTDAVRFTVIRDQSFITLKYTDEYSADKSDMELKVDLEFPALCSMNINFSYNTILRIGKWTGGIWIVDSTTASIFDDKDALLNLVMPCRIDYKLKIEVESSEYVQAEERYGKIETAVVNSCAGAIDKDYNKSASVQTNKETIEPEVNNEVLSSGSDKETFSPEADKVVLNVESEIEMFSLGDDKETFSPGTDKVYFGPEADKVYLNAVVNKVVPELNAIVVLSELNKCNRPSGPEALSKCLGRMVLIVPPLINADIVSTDVPFVPEVVTLRMFYTLLLATMGNSALRSYSRIASGPPGKHPAINKTTGLCRCGP